MSFNEIIKGDKPVLVDFYAEWCGPCKMLAPTITELASEMGDRARILKVNVDSNQAAAAKYKISGVPTLIVFKKGEIVWRQSGVLSKQQLKKVLEQNI